MFIKSRLIRTIPVVALLSIAGCSKNSQESVKAATAKEARDPLQVKVSGQLAGQLKIAEAKWESVAKPLHASGRVQANEERSARIGAPITGRIIDIHVEEGRFVKRGEVLATISSTELSNIQLTFLEAYSHKQLAQHAVDRAEQLLKADVIGSAELQRRKAELQERIEEVSASRTQLDVLGMPAAALDKLEQTRQVTSVSHIVSSMNGILLDRKGTVGQVVQPAETIFDVADLSSVWLIADVPEESSGELRKGKAVQAEVLAFPGETISGQLSFVSPTVDPQTRTVRIRMNLPNARYKYKPDMLATISLAETAHQRLVIPAAALIREDNKDFVFVETGANEFRLRQVTLGADLEDRYALLSGVEPGEKVVGDGAFHLNNERKRLMLVGSE